jgi:type I restriction-modification system DNA methylase subunit
MPKEYICEKCNQDFKQKIDYTRHINKKYPCITQEELKNTVTEDESLKQLESFFFKIRDLLRDNENITGDKALDVITDFLFLRMLNYQLDGELKINILSKKYNEKIKIEKEEFDLDEYKKYFRWNELMNIVNEIDKDSKNHEKKLLLTNVIQHIIFNGILKLNDNTKDIYRNRRFYVQKTTTLMKLLKEYNKINFEDYDVDIKGKAYELTLQKEGATNKDFSQFFTPRWIDKYMVSHAEVKINEDGSYTKLMDPACGTAGILSEYLSFVKKTADKKDIILDNNVSKYIYGYEIVDDTLKIAHMNILLKSGIYNKNLKCKDFLEVGCFDYVDEKFDGHIIMNPPFALTKNYDLTDKESKEVFHTQTKSGTMLFLMSALNSIKDGNQLIMVSPNGKEIFNKNKEFVNIRKHVIENSNLYKIAILPDGAFKPYTGVQTIVLMIRKGEKTKEIQFVKVNKNKDDSFTETKICKVKYDKLKEKDYSWNYKEYHAEETIKYDQLQFVELNKLCNINYGERIVKKESKEGIYPVYGGGDITFYTDKFNRDGTNVLISRFGMSQNCTRKITGQIWLNDSGMTLTIKNNNILQDFLNHFIMLNTDNIYNMSRGAAQKNIDINLLNEMQIPVPPIEVQNLIVKELDLMYKEKERLISSIKDTELLKQIHFDSLLLKCKDKQTVKLGNVCEFNTENKHDTSHGKNEGKYIFHTGGVRTELYVDKYDTDKLTIIINRTNGSGKCNIFLDKNCSFASQTITFRSKNEVTTKIIYTYLSANIKLLEDGFVGTNHKNISNEYVKNISVTLPSLKDQEEIVKQMEKHNERVKCQEEEIQLIDKLIKERFEYHLQQCKDNKDKPKVESKQESDDDSDEEVKPEKKIKVKSKKPKDDTDDEEEEVKIKVKSKKPKDDTDDEEEEVKIKVKSKKPKDDSEDEVKIKVKSKKPKDDSDDEEKEVKIKVKSKKPKDDSDDEEEEVKIKVKSKKPKDDSDDEEEEVKIKVKSKKPKYDSDDEVKIKVKSKKPKDDSDDEEVKSEKKIKVKSKKH